MDEQQPQPDDALPSHGDERRDSVEIQDETISAPVVETAETSSNGAAAKPSTAKLGKASSNSPKRLASPGILGALGQRSGNSALYLTSVGSAARGALGGPKGFTPEADDIATKKRGARHRRVATDTHGKGNESISNADFLKELNKELPREEQAHMKKRSNELKYERDLKHALMKLAESEEQRNTAVEIIGNLERENDDLKQENDRLSNELTGAMTEIQILQKQYTTLQDTYTQDKREFEENARETEHKLKELQEDIEDKELALREAEQAHQRLNSEHEILRLASLSIDDSTTAIGIQTDKEKKLYEKYHNEKRKVVDRDQKIEQLLSKLETNARLEAQNHQLMDELERTKEEAEEALMNQALSQKAMESELIALASRNSQFQKEKEELQRLLEAAEYEGQQFRMHAERGRTMTNRNLLQRGASNVPGGDINVSQDMGNTLEAMEMGQSGSFISYDDEVDYEDDEYYDEQDVPPEEEPAEEKVEPTRPPEKEVPDVVKEYLHLTASAVKIKFPKVTTIESEQLIKQVSQFSFWEYHDHMVRIMKNEEKKLEAKQKEEEQKKQLAQMQQKQQQQAAQSHQNSGILGKFRSWWGAGSSHSGGGNNSSSNGNAANGNARHQSVSTKTKNKNGGLVAGSRVQSKSVGAGKKGSSKSGDKSGSSASGSDSKKSSKDKSGKSGKDSKHHSSNGKDSGSGKGKDSGSSSGKDSKNKENDSKDGNKSDKLGNKKNKSSSKKSKSPAPVERIENGLTKVAEKMGLGSPGLHSEKDMAEMAQQSFKSIQPIAPSEDEAEDGNALL